MDIAKICIIYSFIIIYKTTSFGDGQGHGMSCDVIAVKDSFLKNGGKFQLQVKVFKADGDYYLAGGERFYSFGKWDGKPKYSSWYEHYAF